MKTLVVYETGFVNMELVARNVAEALLDHLPKAASASMGRF